MAGGKWQHEAKMKKLDPATTGAPAPAAPAPVALPDPTSAMTQDPSGQRAVRFKGIQKKLTKYETAERRRQVMKLRLRGLGVPQIAQVLKVKERVVIDDLEVVQRQNAQNVDKFQQNQFVEERVWSEFAAMEAGTPGRLKALDMVRVLQNDRLKALLDTGIVKKDEAVVVEHIHKLDDRWTPTVKATVAKALLEAGLTTQLAEPTPDDSQPNPAPVQSAPADPPPQPPETLDLENEEQEHEGPDMPEGVDDVR
jgi:hypothetical protein